MCEQTPSGRPTVRPPVPTLGLPVQCCVGHQYCFQVLPKFKIFKHLIAPTVVHNLSDKRLKYSFKLWSDFDNDLRQLLATKSMAIQLRFGQSVGHYVKDGLINDLCVEVNGIGVYTDTQESTTTGPFDLSPFCRFGRNEIHFWLSDPTVECRQRCLLEVTVVEVTTCDMFFNKMTTNSDKLLSKRFTKDLIKHRFSGQSSDDIFLANTCFKLSLNCPLSLKRMETPCRSLHCQHIECFDGLSFLRANEYSYQWYCPLCQCLADFQSLKIDRYLKRVLNNTSVNVTEVVIRSDTSFDAIVEEEDKELVDIDVIEING